MRMPGSSGSSVAAVKVEGVETEVVALASTVMSEV